MFDPAGALLQTIATGTNALSGLGYDAGTNTLWVSTGFGDARIRQYDFSGNLLTNFGTPGWVNGLDFVSAPVSSPVPEPTSMLLLGSGLIGAGVLRYRQRRSRG